MQESHKVRRRDYSAREIDEDRYLRLEDLHLDDLRAPSFFSVPGAPFAKFFAAFAKVYLAFVLKLAGLFSPPAVARAVTRKAPTSSSRPSETPTQMSMLMARLKGHLRSPEFWLGVSFGVVVRIATRLWIQSAFPPSQRFSATVIGVFACACAGVAAGVVVHLVRTCYRNSKAAFGAEKEKYFSRALYESALIGLFGGIIGGGATNAGTMILRTGSFAIGATAGGAIGIIHAGVKGYMRAKAENIKMGWGRLAFQGVAFGAVGGVLGGISSDIFSANDSVAAPVGEAGGVFYVQPPSVEYVQDPCGYGCGGTHTIVLQQPTTIIAPIHNVPVAPPPPVEPTVVEHTVQKPVHHPHKVVHKTHHVQSHKHCHTHQPHKVVHHAAKVKHLKHVKHVVKNIVHPPQLPPTYLVPPPPPPQAIVPIVGPAHPVAVFPRQIPINPCAAESCEVPCRTSVIDIKGPCSDPNTPCVQRVSFNDDGAATKVVLERSNSGVTKPHFEVAASSVTTDAPHWDQSINKGASLSNSTSTEGVSRVSLVVPFVHPALGQVGSVAPIPA